MPLGATKTLYLIRHAEGFHNQGASTRAMAKRLVMVMMSMGTNERLTRRRDAAGEVDPRNMETKRTRMRVSPREDGDGANTFDERSRRGCDRNSWRRASSSSPPVGASYGDGGGYVRKRRWRWVRDGVDAGGGDEIVRGRRCDAARDCAKGKNSWR